MNYTPPLSAASPAGAVAATVAANTSTTFNSSSQTITLSATVTSGTVNINEGSETFTVLSGINIIGTPVTVNVANGVASTSTYTLPAGTAAGTYTIQAIYYGTGNYLGSIDASHTLTINAAATTTAAKSASTTYSSVAQTVPSERDRLQRGRRGQRGHRDVHDPERRDDDRHGHLGHDRQRRRQRHRHAARRHRRQQLHDPGRLQRHGEFRRAPPTPVTP